MRCAWLLKHYVCLKFHPSENGARVCRASPLCDKNIFLFCVLFIFYSIALTAFYISFFLLLINLYGIYYVINACFSTLLV
jgi:hypothetical protein